MIKGRKINLDSDPPRLFEDIYLCTEFGRIISRREAQSRKINNIFEIFDTSEEDFTLRNMKFGARPLLLAISKLGPVFIDITLLGRYGLILVIIPSVLHDESLSAAFGILHGEVTPSEKARRLASVFGSKEDFVRSGFAMRMLRVYGELNSFDFSDRTEAECGEFLSERTVGYGELFGCKLGFCVKKTAPADCENRIEMPSFLFALANFTMIAREYSAERCARVDVFFDEDGAYFDFGFKIVSDKRELKLTKEVSQLISLAAIAEDKKLVCVYYQNEDSFVIRVFPWSDYPVGGEMKMPDPEFDY